MFSRQIDSNDENEEVEDSAWPFLFGTNQVQKSKFTTSMLVTDVGDEMC